jgi:hypothetical protein
MEVDLNNLLIMQDMDNALALLDRRGNKLGDRIKAIRNLCGKIDKTGKELDGNTSTEEEREFIDAMSEEMPIVLANLNKKEQELIALMQALKDLKKSKKPEDLLKVKTGFEVLGQKIEEEEKLSNDLEKEIIEWNAQKKLTKRDEELEDAEYTIQEINFEVGDEIREIEDELKTQEKNLKEGANKKSENDIIGLKMYIKELSEFKERLAQIDYDRKELFNEFDMEVPLFIKQQRNLRLSGSNLNKKQKEGAQTQLSYIINRIKSEKPLSFYDMLAVNCKYRKRIKKT